MSKVYDPEHNHWAKELEKETLKEPNLRKLVWYKPLSIFHTLEFRGLDKRDYYAAPKYDEWDYQAWNVPAEYRNMCGDYYIDFMKCSSYLKKEFPILKHSLLKRSQYCWKMHDNFENCKRILIRKNSRYIPGHPIFPEDH